MFLLIGFGYLFYLGWLIIWWSLLGVWYLLVFLFQAAVFLGALAVQGFMMVRDRIRARGRGAVARR